MSIVVSRYSTGLVPTLSIAIGLNLNSVAILPFAASGSAYIQIEGTMTAAERAAAASSGGGGGATPENLVELATLDERTMVSALEQRYANNDVRQTHPRCVTLSLAK